MTTYRAGIRHHSIARARYVTINGSLAHAKRVALREFGDGYRDHDIVILDERGDVVARRRIGHTRWIKAYHAHIAARTRREAQAYTEAAREFVAYVATGRQWDTDTLASYLPAGRILRSDAAPYAGPATIADIASWMRRETKAPP